MAKKRKNRLASGSIRVQRRYVGEDGKSHTKSFTARTKAEADEMANEWLAYRSQVVTRTTISEAVENYIRLKEAVLSPATVRSYEGIRNQYLTEGFGRTELLEVTNTDIQLWISWLVSVRRLSPKTVRNAAALLSATLSTFMPDFIVRVTLPAKIKPDLYCPSTDEVMKVYQTAKDKQVRAAIMLAAVGTMRRGEICALNWGDIEGNTIHIRRALVKDENGIWLMKSPKTYTSARDVPMPADVMQLLYDLPKDPKGMIFSLTPEQLGRKFRRAVDKSGVHHFRFHDLRHYSASQMHLKGIPDKYIETRGGWRAGSSVMKRTYQQVISLEQAKQDKKILESFAGLACR